MFSHSHFIKLWFDFIILYKCLIEIKKEFTAFSWMTWKTAFKTKIVFFVIIIFTDRKTEFWSILILSEWLLNVIWFSLKILLKILIKILMRASSVFVLILWLKIVTTTLIKVFVMLLNLIFFFKL